MIKRTLYFSRPLYIKTKSRQLIVLDKESNEEKGEIPIEDIGMVIIDNPQISLSHATINHLIKNNASIIWCDDKHMPNGLVLPMSANHTYTEKLRHQANASIPLKKQLWKQTVQQKIRNQAAVLDAIGESGQALEKMAKMVRSGDADNYEAQAAALYWSAIFGSEASGFRRHRYGEPPNDLLNFGYAILRSIIARSLVSSGMLPALGIFHRNKYNPYCLADDIMEPYRPFIDFLVLDITERYEMDFDNLSNKEIKRELLQIPVLDVVISKKSSPLMIGAQRTTASLMHCFEGHERKIKYPEFCQSTVLA